MSKESVLKGHDSLEEMIWRHIPYWKLAIKIARDEIRKSELYPRPVGEEDEISEEEKAAFEGFEGYVDFELKALQDIEDACRALGEPSKPLQHKPLPWTREEDRLPEKTISVSVPASEFGVVQHHPNFQQVSKEDWANPARKYPTIRPILDDEEVRDGMVYKKVKE